MVLDEIAEKFRKLAFESLLIVDANEMKNWQDHPCTKYLLNMIQSEYIGKHAQWGKLVFTHETRDGTDQRNAQALGEVEAYEVISSYIKDIAAFKLEAIQEDEDDYT